MGRWQNDDIDWSRFDRERVDPDILATVKAAALVEQNAPDYVSYLYNVFRDDAQFQEAACGWGAEEEQHGRALAAWAMLADPDWDFQAALGRFRENFRLPAEASRSVRGSQAGELIARCVVECGTSSLYSALRDASEEPVLKQIASRIAGDEFRHYKLFYEHMRRYREEEKPYLARRMQVALGRMAEGEDDELAYAYYAANVVTGPYDRKACIAAYGSRALTRYRPGHIKLATNMTMKAVGLKPQSRLATWCSRLVWRLFDWRRGRMVRMAEANPA